MNHSNSSISNSMINSIDLLVGDGVDIIGMIVLKAAVTESMAGFVRYLA